MHEMHCSSTGVPKIFIPVPASENVICRELKIFVFFNAKFVKISQMFLQNAVFVSCFRPSRQHHVL